MKEQQETPLDREFDDADRAVEYLRDVTGWPIHQHTPFVVWVRSRSLELCHIHQDPLENWIPNQFWKSTCQTRQLQENVWITEVRCTPCVQLAT